MMTMVTNFLILLQVVGLLIDGHIYSDSKLATSYNQILTRNTIDVVAAMLES